MEKERRDAAGAGMKREEQRRGWVKVAATVKMKVGGGDEED
ncbi:hypothetical protein COLO4_19847 [Corchorus olitorius]|uniref:Uncharacterized protein n=1 Tax=Corchorus olitorius TaxID=93759 RepID=A0A1R3J317_9ROSI|nr:hypothetical protein COLO4_19847 [Corchorus olitorius]